jgi:hypothetical protein
MADFPETSVVCELVLGEAGEKAVRSRPAIDMLPKEFQEPVPWEAQEEEAVLLQLAVDRLPLLNVKKCVNN